MEIWPSITRIYVGIYPFCTPIPRNLEELLYNKSLDCYIKLVYDCVREVHVKLFVKKGRYYKYIKLVKHAHYYI